MQPLKRRYTRRGDRVDNPEYVNIKGQQVPTGFYGGRGTGAECPDCQALLKDEWYSEPRKIHPEAESEVSASVECGECKSEFQLHHVSEPDINAGLEIARKELRAYPDGGGSIHEIRGGWAIDSRCRPTRRPSRHNPSTMRRAARSNVGFSSSRASWFSFSRIEAADWPFLELETAQCA